MRTTLDIDKPVLDALRKLQKKEKLPLGKIVSRLLSEALAERNPTFPAPFEWASAPMDIKIDISDKDALYRELDRS